MKYKKITIDDSFFAEFDLESDSSFSLKAGKAADTDQFAFQLEMPGIEIGELSEKFAYPVKSVLHEFMDTPGYTVETESVIPFGTEPKIKRKFELLNGIIQITDDIRIHPSTIEDNFKIDTLYIKGKWKQYAFPDLNNITQSLKWNSFSADGEEIIYDSSVVCPVVLLKDEEGSVFELGTGFDLWRWQSAELDSLPDRHMDDDADYPEPVSNFKMVRNGETIYIERTVLKADAVFPITSKNWRFNWYLAWSVPEDEAEKRKCDTMNRVTLDLGGKPDCFHARKNKKLLKNKVREKLNLLNNSCLVLDKITPSLCMNSSHVARSSAASAPHWDLGDLIDLWFWTNRQLLSSDSCFIIEASDNSWFSQLPSYLKISQNLF